VAKNGGAHGFAIAGECDEKLKFLASSDLAVRDNAEQRQFGIWK
jgi:hypothetical protein